jgi:8-oxo-dGTP pyrophosphatase MutT (NUDIX family)
MLDRILRLGATTAHKALALNWFFRRPKTFGAHAVALTPEGRLVLVKLRYAPGWRLPGGGRKKSEPPCDAALRELREEIGMTFHGPATLAGELQESVDFKRDTASLVIVRDVIYRPKSWSWEIETVREVELDDLPPDTSQQTRRWLRMVAPHL